MVEPQIISITACCDSCECPELKYDPKSGLVDIFDDYQGKVTMKKSDWEEICPVITSFDPGLVTSQNPSNLLYPSDERLPKPTLRFVKQVKREDLQMVLSGVHSKGVVHMSCKQAKSLADQYKKRCLNQP